MTRGLLDMPEDVMNKIMEDVGFKGIMTLRKVCHDLRNFIDDVKPNANLEKIWINGNSNNSVSVSYYFAGEIHSIDYKKRRKGCLVKKTYEDNGRLLKNKNFVNVSMKDLKIVLRHQKSVVKKFTLNGLCEYDRNEILLKNIHRILKSRVHPLKVGAFLAGDMNQNQLMSILPFLDSKTLNRIEIRNNENSLLEIDQIVKLDQWKNIKDMFLVCAVDYKYIQDFTHLTTASVNFITTHFSNFVLLKDIYMQSTGFQCISIYITDKNELDKVQRLTELLGEPYLDPFSRLRWYYRIPANNKIINISVGKYSSNCPIKLFTIEEEYVPRDAVIHK